MIPPPRECTTIHQLEPEATTAEAAPGVLGVVGVTGAPGHAGHVGQVGKAGQCGQGGIDGCEVAITDRSLEVWQKQTAAAEADRIRMEAQMRNQWLHDTYSQS